jgi:hypothetical protein
MRIYIYKLCEKLFRWKANRAALRRQLIILSVEDNPFCKDGSRLAGQEMPDY